MPAFTTNQWAILFLVLVLGWLLGLISRSGGAKWRRAYEAERDARVEEQREHNMALSRFPKSCATPAAITPRLSSFWAATMRSWVCFRSVMSRQEPM